MYEFDIFFSFIYLNLVILISFLAGGVIVNVSRLVCQENSESSCIVHFYVAI